MSPKKRRKAAPPATHLGVDVANAVVKAEHVGRIAASAARAGAVKIESGAISSSAGGDDASGGDGGGGAAAWKTQRNEFDYAKRFNLLPAPVLKKWEGMFAAGAKQSPGVNERKKRFTLSALECLKTGNWDVPYFQKTETHTEYDDEEEEKKWVSWKTYIDAETEEVAMETILARGC